jgi:tetratricopeptide (TPR) repeat protein
VLPEVDVVSRFSTRTMALRAASAAEAAPALKADFVLSGRCRQLGDQLIVHAELFDARRDEIVMRMRESAPLASLVSAESPLVQSLLVQIGQGLLSRQLDLARRCALPHLSGYTLLLGGIALMHRLSRRDFERAGQLLEHLSERWPRLPTTQAWLARWHLFSVLQRWSGDADASQRAAHKASQQALDLDSESSIALAVAGSVRIGLAQDVDGGIGLYEQALRANPNDSFAWMLRGTAHAFKGEGPDAIQASGRAARLSPLDPMHFMYDCHAAGAALAADEGERARALALRSMCANAMHLSTYRVLAAAQVMCGDGRGARDTTRRLLVLDPEASVERFLQRSPSAAYPMGQRLAHLLAEAGLPKNGP